MFNLLGPLLNPAPVRSQLVGIYAADLLPTVAEVLSKLGRRSALVVCGEDGLDELSLVAPTRAVRLEGGRTESLRILPTELRLSLCAPESLRGGDAKENARMLEALLSGQEQGPRRDVVLLNAGAALWTAGRAATLLEGLDRAREAIDGGQALATLEKARKFR